jgi:hypothetical protein
VITGEHEFEAQYGLPEPLPSGERLLWQGVPDGRSLAVEALHWRKLAIYFAILLAWRAENVMSGGGSAVQAAAASAWLLPLAAFAIGIALTLATLIRRTTVYTLTDRRVVMRIGIVLTMTLNLPHRQIDGAALHLGRNGHGDIALTLAPGVRIGYIHLWPHARPWQVRWPQPMLRAVPQASRVASLLAQALQATAIGAARTPSATVTPLPLPQPVAATVHAVAEPAARAA